MSRGGGVGRLLRQLGSEDWLSRVIDQYFDRRSARETWGQPNPSIRPSGSGSPCERDIELGMAGHRSAIAGQSRRRMDNGSGMHERWQRYLREMQILVVKESPVNVADPMVTGRLDVVVQNPASGKLALGELKSVHSRGFQSLPRVTADRKANMRALYSWNQPWGRGYVIQDCWYFEFGDVNGRKFDENFFLFENKDTQDYKVIYVEPTPELLAEAKEKPVAAQNAFLEGKLLDRPFQRGHPVCRRCDREKACDLLEDGDDAAWQVLIEQFRKGGITATRPK